MQQFQGKLYLPCRTEVARREARTLYLAKRPAGRGENRIDEVWMIENVISAQAFEFRSCNYLSIALPCDECGAAPLEQHAHGIYEKCVVFCPCSGYLPCAASRRA